MDYLPEVAYTASVRGFQKAMDRRVNGRAIMERLGKLRCPPSVWELKVAQVWTFCLCSQRSPGLRVLRFEPIDNPYTPSPSYGVSSLGFIQTIKSLFLPVLLVKTCYSFILVLSF